MSFKGIFKKFNSYRKKNAEKTCCPIKTLGSTREVLIGCIIKVVKSSKEDVIQLMSQIIQTEMTENMLTNSNVDQLTGSKNINSNNFTIQNWQFNH